jgi:nitrogen fixation protein
MNFDPHYIPTASAWKGEIMTANGWKCALHILFKPKRT